MKNILSILKDFGIEIAEDKTKELEKAVNENYKTINEYDSIKTAKEQLEADIKQRDADLEDLKAKASDSDSLNEQLAEMTKKYEDAKKDAEEQLSKQAYEYAVKEKINGLKFTSKTAQKGFTDEVIKAGLKLENGELLGFDDYVKKAKEEDSGLFATEENNKPQWTKGQTGGAPQKMSKEDILKIQNRAERQEAIAQNIELFR